MFKLSFYGQLFADIKMRNHKLRTNKTGTILFQYLSKIMEDDFSVWLRAGSNPADINYFRNLTGKALKN